MPLFASAPVGIGQGYDSVRGDARNTALSATTQTHGGISYPRYRVCEGMQQVMDALEINQSLSIDLFGIVSINQKLEFVKSQELTTNSVCIIAYARHTEGTETATDVALRPDVKAPQTNEELREFFQAYGDSYVVSRSRGGEYYGVYTYYAEKQEQQRQLMVEMEAGGILKVVAGDGNLQVAINNFHSSQNIRTTFDQNLTGIANPSFPLPENVIEFALAFPSLKLTSPVLTHFETIGYHRAPGLASFFRPVAENVERLLHQQHILAADRSRLRELQNAIHAINAVYAFYPSTRIQDDKLQHVEKQVEADMEAIQAMLEGYEEDPAKPLPDKLEMSSLRNGMPALAFVTQESNGFGVSDQIGNPSLFDDVSDIRSYLQQRTKITAVEMFLDSAGTYLGSVIVSYDNGNTGSWTARHGLDKISTLSERLVVPQEHPVSMVEGHYSNVIDHLIVELTNGEKIAVGRVSTTEFMSPTPDNFFLVGFRGRAGFFLNQLQMVYASFIPVAWAAPAAP